MTRFVAGLALCLPMAYVIQNHPQPLGLLVLVCSLLASVGGWVMTRSAAFAFIVLAVSVGLFFMLGAS